MGVSESLGRTKVRREGVSWLFLVFFVLFFPIAVAPEVGDICSHLSSHMEKVVPTLLTWTGIREGITKTSRESSKGNWSQHDLASK
ncbi:hypothetical protein M413DRAFT_442901 [Hebeloma cylindrosporum]|uniref:Uncharacterized protein n=1 Tax=Hebeloma cylindrosporum TaxID=76867 RepID=A0A0C2YV77_HEBCY|nr:hypothetical protein M413DRAFT_442901 [Hebeloma cylindrosporum h7]